MRPIFWILWIVFCHGVAHGKTLSQAEQFIHDTVKEQVKLECLSCDVEIHIHNKILLSDISKPDFVLADHWKGQTNLLIKLGDKTRIITATIRWKDDVVVAAKNIRQGHMIDAEDLRVVKKDVTFLKTNYVRHQQEVMGWEGKRVFQRGQVIDEALLRKPIVVKYGQPIKLLLKEGALLLEMSGQAKGAGAIGDRIPVMVDKTRTKVSAQIVGKNLARVE